MKKVISIFLLLVMLFGSSGVTMAAHYCGGHVTDMAITFGQADLDCGMKQMEMDCANENSPTRHEFQKKGCCENQYTSIESEDATTTELVVGSFHLDFFVAFVFTYPGFNLFGDDNSARYLTYSPPRLRQDRPVLYQSFLI